LTTEVTEEPNSFNHKGHEGTQRKTGQGFTRIATDIPGKPLIAEKPRRVRRETRTGEDARAYIDAEKSTPARAPAPHDLHGFFEGGAEVVVGHYAGVVEGYAAFAVDQNQGRSGAGAVAIEIGFADGNGDGL